MNGEGEHDRAGKSKKVAEHRGAESRDHRGDEDEDGNRRELHHPANENHREVVEALERRHDLPPLVVRKYRGRRGEQTHRDNERKQLSLCHGAERILRDQREQLL